MAGEQVVGAVREARHPNRPAPVGSVRRRWPRAWSARCPARSCGWRWRWTAP